LRGSGTRQCQQVAATQALLRGQLLRLRGRQIGQRAAPQGRALHQVWQRQFQQQAVLRLQLAAALMQIEQQRLPVALIGRGQIAQAVIQRYRLQQGGQCRQLRQHGGIVQRRWRHAQQPFALRRSQRGDQAGAAVGLRAAQQQGIDLTVDQHGLQCRQLLLQLAGQNQLRQRQSLLRWLIRQTRLAVANAGAAQHLRQERRQPRAPGAERRAIVGVEQQAALQQRQCAAWRHLGQRLGPAIEHRQVGRGLSCRPCNSLNTAQKRMSSSTSAAPASTTRSPPSSSHCCASCCKGKGKSACCSQSRSNSRQRCGAASRSTPARPNAAISLT
jgi:hypothetical protein